MLGPILGPTLGGWLTDTFDWRWVFYVNVPFGILAALGLWFFLKGNGRDNSLRFDWIGFGVLSLGLGAFQLMLDRGQQLDWFSSNEIVLEGMLAALGIYLFVVHMLTAKKPFLSPQMFVDRNFVAGMIIMFTVGLVLLSSAALLPGYLQRLGGYSVTEAGLLMAPRGIGTMVAMMIAGRLTGRFDARMIMLFGIATMAFTLWLMTGWTPDVSRFELIWVTTLQGFGMGFVFIPLQVVAFATLPGQYRTDGASLFALMRNVGSAIGISIATWLLSVSTATMYQQLGENVNAFNRAFHIGPAGLFYNPNIPMGLAGISAEVTRQAEIIAYSNDFMFLFWVSLPAALALLLMRKSNPHAPKPDEAAHVMD
jgi:DHA2 family multidrug resistance protein